MFLWKEKLKRKLKINESPKKLINLKVKKNKVISSYQSSPCPCNISKWIKYQNSLVSFKVGYNKPFIYEVYVTWGDRCAISFPEINTKIGTNSSGPILFALKLLRHIIMTSLEIYFW